MFDFDSLSLEEQDLVVEAVGKETSPRNAYHAIKALVDDGKLPTLAPPQATKKTRKRSNPDQSDWNKSDRSISQSARRKEQIKKRTVAVARFLAEDNLGALSDKEREALTESRPPAFQSWKEADAATRARQQRNQRGAVVKQATPDEMWAEQQRHTPRKRKELLACRDLRH